MPAACRGPSADQPPGAGGMGNPGWTDLPMCRTQGSMRFIFDVSMRTMPNAMP